MHIWIKTGLVFSSYIHMYPQTVVLTCNNNNPQCTDSISWHYSLLFARESQKTMDQHSQYTHLQGCKPEHSIGWDRCKTESEEFSPSGLPPFE